MFARSAAFATAVVLLLRVDPSLPGSPGHPTLDPMTFVCPFPPRYAVTVTPDGGTGGTQSWQQNTGPHTATFTVKNTGPCLDTYSFSYSTSGPISGVSLDKSSDQVAAGTSTPVTATYSVGAAGSAVLTLTASGNAGDQGYYNVTVTPPPYQVAVTPHGGTTANRLTNTAYTDTFTVQNTGANSDTYSLTCIGSSGITCGSLSPAGPITLGSYGQSQKVAVNYMTGAGGFWTLRLAALGSSTDTGTYSVPVITYGVAVTPHDSTTAQRPAHTSGYSESFTVRNTGLSDNTYSLSCSTSANVTCTGLTRNGSSVSSMLLGSGGYATIVASDSVGAVGNGTLSLTAMGTNASDSGRYHIPVVTPSALPSVVDINSVNPGTFAERGLCLAIAVGAAAASECGDLRIVHALPTTRTMNKSRTPTLLYNSQTAHPYPIVAANVTLPSTAAVPDSVTGILTIGGVTRARAKWLGGQWAPGQIRRVALAFDASGDATGVYAYTLEIRNWYSDPTPSQPTTVAAELVVVNRSNSPFGAGWWLAGLEQFFWLPDGRKLIVLGDGSPTVYSVVGTNLYTAPNPTRPDTLDGRGADYVRLAPHGVRVHFSATTGKHITTVNRLGQQTTFVYDTSCARLRTITLPPGGSGTVYTFNYASPTDCATRLASVTAPGNRTTNLTDPSGQVTAISDPDSHGVGFSYDPGFANRMVSRTDRRGTTTFYAFDAGSKLTTDSLPLGTGQTPIVQRIRPVESFGLATAMDTAVATTRLDGPRVDVADTTAFWLDRFGEPRRIRNALGHETILTRGDTRWPALVTRVRYPNGRVDGAAYDGHGNLTEATDSSHFADRLVVPPCPLGPPCMPGTMVRFYATTRYTWDPNWDFVTSVVRPEEDSIVMAYDATTGNRLWQQIGPDPARRVRFQYVNNCGLLSSDSLPADGLPATPIDSVEYDGMCNAAVVRTPNRFDMRINHDSIGRDTMVQVRIDTLGDTPTYQVTVTRYNVMDQETLQISAGPALSGAGAETTFVRKFYNDTSGLLDSLSRWGHPDVKNVNTITTRWRYDRAGRTIAEIAPEGADFVDSSYYDPAGNDTLSVTRGHLRIRATYDALNRLSTRILPPVSYRDTASAISTLNGGLPTTFSGYQVPRDSLSFTYDSLGGIRTASNADAMVKRSYYPNGLIQTDSVWIRTVQDTVLSQHKYGISYTYDLDSREISVDVPNQLDPQTVADQLFHYDVIGQLSSAISFGDSAHFSYDARGEVTSILFPGQWTQTYSYDADGRLVTDALQRQGSGASRSVTYKYDARNKIFSGVDAVGYLDTLRTSYSGLGYILHSLFTQHGTPPICQANWRYLVDETFAYDPLGNRGTWSRTEGTNVANCIMSLNTIGGGSAYAAVTGRMTADTTNQIATHFAYDSTGAIKFSQKLGPPAEERASYYAADGKLRATDTRSAERTGHPVWWNRAFDEYRYDALGRRIWMRSRKSCLTSGADPVQATECQTSILRRTIWDGDQVLAEIQMPGGDNASDTTYWEKDTNVVSLPAIQFTQLGDPSRYFGRVIYAHGAGIDHPLFVTRYNYVRAVNDSNHAITPPYVIPYARFMPFWNALGEATLGAFNNGEQKFCPGSIGRCEDVFWPYTFSAWNREHGTDRRTNWQGSLLENGQDKSGLQFRRNRYYDPTTGRFTQEDPIGLAGGLNLYGFASGDPVTFSDPFGLFDCKNPKTLSEAFACIGNWTVPLQDLVENKVGEISGLNELGRAGDALTKGHFGAAALHTVMALPELPGEGKVLGFAAGKWLPHFEKHAAKLGFRTAVEYLRGANALIHGTEGVETFVRANGDKLFYREATNEFAALARDGKTIRTYFRPDDGLAYWLRQIQ